MNTGLRFTLALALAIGTATLATTPVAAAKKEKPPAAPQLKLGKAFRDAAVPIEAALKANNAAGAVALLPAMDAVALTPDEKFFAGQIRLNTGITAKDEAMQIAGLDQMIASGGAPAAELPKYNYYSGSFAYNKRDYAKAAARLLEADRLGYKATDLLILAAEANFKQNKIPEGLALAERAITGSESGGGKAPESWYQRATSEAYKAKSTVETAKWMRKLVKAYPTPENWRSALVLYRDAARLEGQAALDLMRLMRITKSLTGERDFYEFASLATERALPGEAKSAIEEGFASGAVTRTSRPVNEMLTLANGKIAADRASLVSSEKSAPSAPNGKAAAGTADGFLGYGDDAKAITLYRLALQKGNVDVDQVNTRLGIALARSGQKDAAREVFALVKGPRAEIASFWTLWLDTTATPAPTTPAAG